MNIENALKTETNYAILIELAEKANDQTGQPATAFEAVCLAAATAIMNHDEDEINSWDLTDIDSCGVNRYEDGEFRKVFWDAFIGSHQGDDVTRCALADAATAEKWYDTEWSTVL